MTTQKAGVNPGFSFDKNSFTSVLPVCILLNVKGEKYLAKVFRYRILKG